MLVHYRRAMASRTLGVHAQTTDESFGVIHLLANRLLFRPLSTRKA